MGYRSLRGYSLLVGYMSLERREAPRKHFMRPLAMGMTSARSYARCLLLNLKRSRSVDVGTQAAA